MKAPTVNFERPTDQLYAVRGPSGPVVLLDSNAAPRDLAAIGRARLEHLRKLCALLACSGEESDSDYSLAEVAELLLPLVDDSLRLAEHLVVRLAELEECKHG